MKDIPLIAALNAVSIACHVLDGISSKGSLLVRVVGSLSSLRILLNGIRTSGLNEEP